MNIEKQVCGNWTENDDRDVKSQENSVYKHAKILYKHIKDYIYGTALEAVTKNNIKRAIQKLY